MAVAVVVVATVLLAACHPNVDHAFGDDGTLLVPFGQGDPPNGRFATAPTPDGGLVLTSYGTVPVARLDRHGDEVPGWARIPAGTFTSVEGVVADHGRYLVSGYSAAPDTFRLVRLTTNGALDPSFGNGGIADVPTPAGLRVIPLPQGGYFAVQGFNGIKPDDGMPVILTTIRLNASGAVVGTTPLRVNVDPANVGNTPPNFIGWEAYAVPTPSSTGGDVVVTLSAVTYGGSVPGGGGGEVPTAAITSVDASGQLPPPVAAAGITPPPLSDGPFWLQVVDVGDGRKVVSRSTNAGITIGVPGSWTAAVTPPWALSAAAASLVCRAQDRVLVGGTGTDGSGRSIPFVASYRLSDGKVDQAFGDHGFFSLRRNEPDTASLEQIGPLVPAGTCACGLYATVAQWTDDGGWRISKLLDVAG